ncbi:MAG: hypothetical protein AB7V08_14020 [Elusimicrobiales bacterium]
MPRRALMDQRHITTPRPMRDGAARTWDRRRYGGMVHYRLFDRTRTPERTGACSFAPEVPRATVARTLRLVRGMMRE